ncbi:MAG TPA: hypothetical protein VFA68_07570 [Terriglobales bacterium]|nr:hypothetical protein [Terriglobales bacterium]
MTMTNTGAYFGSISGAAVARAADAMLRCMGGDEVQLVMPAMGMPPDPSGELGLVDPGVELISFAPVVIRTLATANNGPRRRLEVLLPASAIQEELVARNIASAGGLFDGALGVTHDGEMFHIEGYATEYFAGSAYLYRLVIVD